MSQEGNIRIRIDGSAAAAGSNRVKQELNSIDKVAVSTTKTVNSLNVALTALGATMSAAIAMTALIDFEQSMATVKAITRSTGDDFDSLREKAKQLGADTRYSSSEAAEALRYLAQAGLNTNEILKSSADVLSLAQAGGLGLADASEIAAKALRAFQLDASQMGDVADLMAKAFTAANTNVQEMGEAFKYAAPVATGFGVSMKDTTAAISALSDAGISASMAGTSLRNIMTRLASPTDEAKQLLRGAGLSMEQLNIQARGLIPVLESLANSTLSVEDAMLIFGQRAGPGFEVLREAIPKLQRFSKEWENLGGFAKETARIMDANLKGAVFELSSALEFLFIETMEVSGGLSGLETIIRDLTDIISAIAHSGFAEYFDEVAVAIGVYIAATQAATLWTGATSGAIANQVLLLQMVGARYGLAAAASTAFTGALAAARAGVMALTASMGALLASPVFWAVAAGAGLYALYQHFEALEEKTQELRDTFRATISDAKNASREMQALAAESALNAANAALKTATDEVNTRLQTIETSIFGLSDATDDVAITIEDRLATVAESFTGFNADTIAAGASIRNLFAAIQNAPDSKTKIESITTGLRTLRILMEKDSDNKVLKNLYSDLEALAGAYIKADQARKKLADTSAEKKAAEAVAGLSQQMIELNTLMTQINKAQIINPTTSDEALTWLREWTEDTDIAKTTQYELEKATAAASMALLSQASALAIVQGRAIDAAKILGQVAILNAQIAQVKPPKLSTDKRGGAGGGGGESKTDQIEKFRQSALDKIKELELKILETQYEINGQSEKELEVIKLKIQAQKELDDIRRRAAEAGMKDSEELTKAEQLTAQLYQMKQAVAEYAASWEPALRPMRDQVDMLSAMGANADYTMLKLKEMEQAMIAADPSIGAEEKARRLNLVNAELIKIRDNLYGTRVGEQTGLEMQMYALNEAWAAGKIQLEQYQLQLVQTGLALAQIKQQAGDATFVDNISLALGAVVENYKGIAAGLTQTWGAFFQSFTQGFADSVAQAIVYQEDLGTAIYNVARQAIASLISSLIQLGIQWVIMQALATTMAAGTAAAMSPIAAQMAAAWTPAAFMASVASFGGAAAAGTAGLAIGLAASKAMTTVGAFADGGLAQGWAMVGEEGPELVNFSNPGRVYTARETQNMIRNTGNAGKAQQYSNKDDFYGGVALYVSVEYYGTQNVDFQVEQLSENRVRVIAREEAKAITREYAPQVISADMANPNSATSKSLSQNTKTQRRYGN